MPMWRLQSEGQAYLDGATKQDTTAPLRSSPESNMMFPGAVEVATYATESTLSVESLQIALGNASEHQLAAEQDDAHSCPDGNLGPDAQLAPDAFNIDDADDGISFEMLPREVAGRAAKQSRLRKIRTGFQGLRDRMKAASRALQVHRASTAVTAVIRSSGADSNDADQLLLTSVVASESAASPASSATLGRLASVSAPSPASCGRSYDDNRWAFSQPSPSPSRQSSFFQVDGDDAVLAEVIGVPASSGGDIGIDGDRWAFHVRSASRNSTFTVVDVLDTVASLTSS